MYRQVLVSFLHLSCHHLSPVCHRFNTNVPLFPPSRLAIVTKFSDVYLREATFT